MRLIFAMLLFAAISCNNKEEKKETLSMPGAYNMLSQTLHDSTYKNVQLKIYTEDYMMYAHINPPDSLSGFGIATYTVNDTGTVTEHVLYHASATAADSNATDNTLQIEKTPKGFKQTIPNLVDEGKKIKLTEEYESAGDTEKTALDGLWKGIAIYTVKGTDTTKEMMTQYKAYYAGHFIFGHTYTDSAGKYHSGIGFGTFTLSGANKVKENASTSTYYDVRGHSFDIDIELNGADAFKQTITFPDGTKEVELYQRMKK
jgi:hypothetical protein